MGKKAGFTIAELVITIIVIAILATISIVVYSSSQENANRSLLQATLTQSATKLETYKHETGDQYPALFEDTGISLPQNVSYQYYPNNTSSPRSYCLEIQRSGYANVVYRITASSQKPVEGTCVISNLIANPSREVNGSDWGYHTSGGAATFTNTLSSAAPSGQNYATLQWTSDTTSVANSGPYVTAYTIQPNQYYSGAMMVLVSKQQSMRLCLEFRTTAGTHAGPQSCTNFLPVSANIWTRLTIENQVTPAGTDRIIMTAYTTTSGSLMLTGDYMLADSAIIVASKNIVPYSDGSTPGWTWSGTTQLSRSSGPVL